MTGIRKRWSALAACGLALAMAAPAAAAGDDAEAARAAAEDEAPAGEGDGLLVRDQIVVTAGRTEQSARDLPVHVTVLDAAEIDAVAGGAADDLLRQLPSFNLQRPGSSRWLNPSNQSVAYRGLGGTSASRSLVLVDGVPLNEPFAGWISWSRVPLASLDRVEVVPGGAAGAWGNQSLGGVIHLITRRPQAASADLSASYGSRSTIETTGLASHVVEPFAFSLVGSYYDSDGESEVPARLRGPADTTNTSESSVLDARLEARAGESTLWTFQSSRLVEDREGGDRLSREHLGLTTFRVAADRVGRAGSTWKANVFALLRDAASARGSISDDRASVTPSRDQFDIPSTSLGFGLGWTAPRRGHLLSAGLDLLATESELHEDASWSSDAFRTRFASGGRQLLAGAYLQDSLAVGERWRWVAGGRVDLWRASDGFFVGRDLASGEPLYDDAPEDRREVVFSPNLGVRVRAARGLDLRAAAYQSFRAPTPNELLKSSPSTRKFLAANGALEPERVRLGLEAGLDRELGRRVILRATGFWTEIENAIADLTVGVAGDAPEVIEPCGRLRAGGVCSQRHNVDLVRARGAELDLEVQASAGLRLWGAYTYTDSRMVEVARDPRLEGRWLRRIPEHQATLQASWAAGRVGDAALLVRYQGERWEEDLNELLIDDSVVVDLRLARALRPRLEAFVAVENLLDAEIAVGRNDEYEELGPGRHLRLGVRYGWQGARRGR